MGNALGCACTDVDTKTITKIEKERSCTDVIFIIAFMMLWGAVFAILGTATSRGGDARKLVYGQDYYGYVCGRDDAVKDKPYVAFADLYSAPDALLCIENCALTNTSDRMGFKYTSTTYLRYCLPKFASDAAKTSDDFNSVSQRSSRAIGDLYTSYGVIAGSCGIAFGLAFLYLIIVQKIAGILVWTMILLVLLGGAFVSASLLKYGSSDNAANANKDAMYALGIVCAVLTFLYFCLVVFLRDRITLAIEVVKESSKALEDMKFMVLFPVVPFFMACGYFVWFVFLSLWIFSVSKEAYKPNPNMRTIGTISYPWTAPAGWPSFPINGTTQVGYKVFSWDDSMKGSFAVHFFHMLWNIQFFEYFSFLVISGAVANWYFTPIINGTKARGDGDDQLSERPVWDSFKRVLRYHLGTVLFASLIIATIQFIRWFVAYSERQMRKIMNPTIAKIVSCCIQCCLKCLECCLDKINKKGLIFTAIYGFPFCSATCGAFTLVWNNLARIAAVSMVGDFLLFLGNLFVCLLTTGICGMILLGDSYSSTISSPVLPIVVIFFLSYCIGSVFMVVYDTAIETVFICFLVDEKCNKGKQMLASADLQRIINAHAEASQKQAEQMKEGRAAPAPQQ